MKCSECGHEGLPHEMEYVSSDRPTRVEFQRFGDAFRWRCKKAGPCRERILEMIQGRTREPQSIAIASEKEGT